MSPDKVMQEDSTVHEPTTSPPHPEGLVQLAGAPPALVIPAAGLPPLFPEPPEPPVPPLASLPVLQPATAIVKKAIDPSRKHLCRINDPFAVFVEVVVSNEGKEPPGPPNDSKKSAISCDRRERDWEIPGPERSSGSGPNPSVLGQKKPGITRLMWRKEGRQWFS
jgi:hypothetical protein